MKLSELSGAYRAGDAAITARIWELSARLRASDDPEEQSSLRQRIRDLRPIQRETRQLAELTARYYERGYWRNEEYTL